MLNPYGPTVIVALARDDGIEEVLLVVYVVPSIVHVKVPKVDEEEPGVYSTCNVCETAPVVRLLDCCNLDPQVA